MQRRLGAAAWRELCAYGQERDSGLFYDAWLGFGIRQEEAGREDLADAVYAAIAAAEGRVASSAVGEALARRASLRGGGTMGHRAEFLLRRLAREALNPVPLLAMAAAGTAFRLVRFGALRSLSSAGAASLLGRGGVRMAAGTAGFFAEAVAFPLAERGLRALQGEAQDGSAAAWGHDLAVSLATLGSLRASGAAGEALFRRLGPESTARALGSQLLMLNGLLLGRGIEAWAGLRGPATGGILLVDSLATLLHFNIAGNLSGRLLGPTFQAWDRDFNAWAEGPAIVPRAARLFSLRPAGDGPSPGLYNMTENSESDDDAVPTPRLPSAWPPRTSVIIPQGTKPPSLSPPAEGEEFWGDMPLSSPAASSLTLEDALPLLVPRLSGELRPVRELVKALDWLAPADRRRLVREALTHADPDEVLERIARVSLEVNTHEAARHALRLLHAFRLEQPQFSGTQLHGTLRKIQQGLPAESQAERAARWQGALHRLQWVWESRSGSDSIPTRILDFELELERASRLGFPLAVVDDLFDLSRGSEAEGPTSRKGFAGLAASFAPVRGPAANPWAEFMAGGYILGRLAETGQFAWARTFADNLIARSRVWEQTTPELSYFLRGRLQFQKSAVDQYIAVLAKPDRTLLEQLYQFYAAHSGEHFPRPYGLIRNLRDQAELLPSGSEPSQKRLRLAASLLNTLILDPVVSRRSLAAEDLIYQQAELLQAAVQDRRTAGLGWNEPVAAMIRSLVRIGDWDGAYRILDACYYLNLTDPMTMQNSLLSVTGGIETQLNREASPVEQGRLREQLRRFFDLDQRIL